jgi:hypothetical protein
MARPLRVECEDASYYLCAGDKASQAILVTGTIGPAFSSGDVRPEANRCARSTNFSAAWIIQR